MTIYRGTALPAEYKGQAIIGDVGSNIVHRKALRPNGVGFDAVRIDDHKEFLTSSEIWFRPVQFANAPDGGLYIIDMYREVIEHPKSLPPAIKQHLDLTSGRDRGRVYRVVAKDFKQPAPVNLDRAASSELVAALSHPNAWQRETAARLLYQRQDDSALKPLREVVRGGASPLGRMHALYVLDGMHRLTAETILAALQDRHPRVREHAVRLSEPLAAKAPEVRSALYALAGDDDPRVRYQLAFSLGELSGGQRNAALAKIAKRDAGDSWVRLAVLSSLSQGAGEVFSQLLADASVRQDAAGRALLGELASMIGAGGKRDAIAEVFKSLAALPAGDKRLGAALVGELSQGLGKTGAALRQALAAAEGNSGAILDDLLANARRVAADETKPTADRAEAIRTLGLSEFAAQRDLLARLLDNRQPAEVQLAALAAISRFADPGVAPLVLKPWSGYSPRVRAQAAETLFARPERVVGLLDALASGEVKPTQLDPARIKLLRAHRDAKIRAQADKLLADVKLQRRQDVVDAYQASLSLPGDAARGKLAFKKVCAACHKVQDVGQEIGPNLAAMKNRGPETILLNVLDPNREVNPQYLNYVLVTNDGRSLTGMIAAETATSVTLRRGENQSDTVLRKDIDALQSTGLSIMPEGIEKQIDAQTMADLIAFLLSAK